MARPKIRITLVERRGPRGCNLCPMAMHVAFPYIDILRYSGAIPGEAPGTARFCCPDVDTLNIFRIERVEEDDT